MSCVYLHTFQWKCMCYACCIQLYMLINMLYGFKLQIKSQLARAFIRAAVFCRSNCGICTMYSLYVVFKLVHTLMELSSAHFLDNYVCKCRTQWLQCWFVFLIKANVFFMVWCLHTKRYLQIESNNIFLLCLHPHIC